jgi:hypothetical protein
LDSLAKLFALGPDIFKHFLTTGNTIITTYENEIKILPPPKNMGDNLGQQVNTFDPAQSTEKEQIGHTGKVIMVKRLVHFSAMEMHRGAD